MDSRIFTQTIAFNGKEHEEFFWDHLNKCRNQDAYHMALLYCLGIDSDTRKHVDEIYDFKAGCIKETCIHDKWQTSNSKKMVRLAFSVYCNGMPGIQTIEDVDKLLQECEDHTVDDLYRGRLMLLQLCNFFLKDI